MNRKDFNAISKLICPDVARKLSALEKALDKHFIDKGNYRKKEYQAIKKLISDDIVNTLFPQMKKRITKLIRQQHEEKMSVLRELVRGPIDPVLLKKALKKVKKENKP